MTYPPQALAHDPARTPYPRTSRYFGIAPAVHTDASGQAIPYLPPRPAPRPDAFVTVQAHEVRVGDRADILAGRHLGDPEQWWQLADANPVLDPRDLTATPGRRVRITLPAGVPGS
ncbi:hypothetical protein Ssi03_68960 [Sphaerisporangium siamense]|uniref:LysM domain-containing protein n=1 Tax=Sphaerisporangium siamense TaxID=795645 RepID=A0A7W7D810_9ACTN|nr:LysM domain-containing protein [Sphaerisporangium siamense]MBB4700563.1 hypothetical protein [Sphaerisporangium siamense]GII88906.1 hypothetical protein Ssi03_68960 [Sphaerisporangium siamense]